MQLQRRGHASGILITGCLAALLALVAVGVSLPALAFNLGEVTADVQSRYAAIGHITPSELAARLKAGDDIVLLDTREAEEFAVSHLNGAARLDPGTWVWDFTRAYADKLRGKTVVFYCSVGVRSSRMAEYVKTAALEAGAKEVLNLAGGIFAWANADMPLRNATGPTPYVHPYDAEWGQLVAQRQKLRTTPEVSAPAQQ